MKMNLPQVIILVAAVFVIGTIVPSLLDAKSDVSVLLGVVIVASVLYAVVKYGKKIAKMIGFDLGDGEEEK